jgi:C-terminal processing protease CtpA/Prc
MVAEFDAALAGLMDAPGLILDLRDNGGGSSLVANQIAGRFLEEPFVYGREYYRQRLPTRGWWRWGDRSVTPRPPFYSGPLVLLMDASTVSSAEEFVVSLVDSGRAQTVGRQTGGSTGNPLVFQLPGSGSARFSTGDLRRIDGAPIEGVGIRPDLPVAWTLEDVRQGRDPDLDAAVRLLLSVQRTRPAEAELLLDFA